MKFVAAYMGDLADKLSFDITCKNVERKIYKSYWKHVKRIIEISGHSI